MTETIMPAEIVDDLKPDYVSSWVAWLCHARCTETGGLFEVGASYYAKLRWERSRGLHLSEEVAANPESLVSLWPKVIDFSMSGHPERAEDAFTPVLYQLRVHRPG